MKNFFFIALLALAFCGCQNNKSQQSSEADIEAMVNERVAAKLAEQGVESNNTAEASDGKTQYAYEFVLVVLHIVFHLTLKKNPHSCTLKALMLLMEKLSMAFANVITIKNGLFIQADLMEQMIMI